jgi:hypothetical protein
MATAAEIQAELAAGPQTQEALDAALLRYSPAEMAAAFPQFGNVADFNNAAAEAAARAQQNAPAQQDSGPTLTAEQRDFITWQGQQISPVTGQRISDTWASQGITNPFSDPRLVNQAQEQLDRATRREDLFAQAGINPGDLRPWSDAPPPTVGGGGLLGGGTGPRTVVGGGGVTPGTAPVPGGGSTTPAPGGGGAPANPRIQAIQQWYSANAGRTDPQAQGDLNRWLATSGYTAREINTALPQWGLNDLQNAMRTAIGEVAQQTPFAPAVTQPLAQPYTSIASQLPGGADTRMQEIRNYYAANEGRGDQAGLDRFLASGYTAQEINRALPQFGVADLDRAIATARQQNPDAALQRQLAAYQATAPGAQFTGAVSPYGLLTQQTQAFTNPYADTLANTVLGGYNPGVYNVLLDETVDPVTGAVIPGSDGSGNTGAGGASAGDAAASPGETGVSAEGEASAGGPGSGGGADNYMGGLITQVFGPDPDGPDEGQINIQRGEYVIKKSAVKKYGKGLLDMINDGKVPAKKMKSLLG